MGGKTEIVDRDYFRIPWDGLMSLPIAFCAIPILGFAPNILNPYLSESLMKNIVYYQVRPIKMYVLVAHMFEIPDRPDFLAVWERNETVLIPTDK